MIVQRRKIPLSFFFIIISIAAKGQGVLDLKAYQEKYPENPAVYLTFKKEIVIDKVGDSIQVFETKKEEILHLNNNSKFLAKDKVFSSFFIKTKFIDASTLVPDNGSLRKMRVEDFVNKDESSEGVFYDDSKSTNFIFPGIQPGAITSLEYTQQILDPRFLGSFFFQSFLPVEKAQLTLKVNKNITVNSRMFNQGELTIDVEQSRKGKFTIYTWTAHNVDKIRFEENAPNYSYFSPHLVFYIEKVKEGNTAKVILENVGDLFQWYSSFTENLKRPENPDLKKKVEELTRGITSEEEKVKKIFYWVQDNIKYIAFEEGMRGFIPHNADYIYANRYGDCKDMACMTKSMLELANIKGYLTWIGSRDIPYTYEEVPTPIVDNHMITTYINGDKTYFLDATSNYTPFGLPSSMIQGKEALVQTGKNSFKLEKVPVVDRKINFIVDSSFLKIDKGQVQGSGFVSLGGYDKIFTTYRISYNSGSKLDDVIKSKLTRGNNKFLLNNYEIDNLEDKDKPLTVKYTYTIDDYYKQISDEIYFNLNLDKTFFNQFIDLDHRKYPIENEYKYQHTFITVIQVPVGFEIEYLPENSEYENETGGFSIKYISTSGQIQLEKRIFVDYLLLEPGDFHKWNEFVENISNVYSDAIILKKIH